MTPEQIRLLAFLRLTLCSEVLPKHWWVWRELVTIWDLPSTLPPLSTFQHYEELELSTLKRTGYGQSQEFMLETTDSIIIIDNLRRLFNLRPDGIERRTLHQYIYLAIGAKPCLPMTIDP